MKIKRFLVYSDIWVGLAVAALSYLSMVEYDIWLPHYLFFSFLATVCTYNYMRIVHPATAGESIRENQVAWIQQRRLQAWLFTLLAGVGSLFFLYPYLQIKYILLLILPVAIALLYPLGFKKPFGSFTSLRNLPGIKVFLIALCWAFITQFFPGYISGKNDNYFLIDGFMRLLLVVALIIPFDIRDMETDDRAIATIPQQLGLRRSRWLGMCLCGLFLGWKMYGFALGFIGLSAFIAWVFLSLLSLLLIDSVHPRRGEMYTAFWVEGVPVFTVLIYFLIQMVN